MNWQALEGLFEAVWEYVFANLLAAGLLLILINLVLMGAADALARRERMLPIDTGSRAWFLSVQEDRMMRGFSLPHPPTSAD